MAITVVLLCVAAVGESGEPQQIDPLDFSGPRSGVRAFDERLVAVDESTECDDTFIDSVPSPASQFAFLDRLRVFGQVRIRQETDFERIQAPTRNRQRLRMRLGATYELNSELLIGARMTTGDRKSSLEPLDRQGAPLSYQNLGDAFDKFEFNLDRIYFEMTPDWLTDTTIWLGKFQLPVRLNPLFAGPVGDLIWDEAAQAEGVAASRSWENSGGTRLLEFNGGVSPVLELGNGDDAAVYYGQLWSESDVSDHLALSTGVSYFHWTNLNPDDDTTLSGQNNSGNATVQIGPNPEDVVFASQFRTISSIVALTLRDHGLTGDPLRIAWETFYNTGSFRSDRDTGYSIGAAYGSAIDTSNQGDWEVYYTWNSVEQESVFSPVGQDDFQRSTNFRGQMFGWRRFVWDDVPVRISFLSDKPILPINGSTESEWRARIDLTANF